ncbi:glycosyltransferase family 2 protein [Facklamia sp. 7083-14-GEN3]|uniref:glycosyltransferase family 2 protein n=1 Tax=Facklamia sp. 7083-14-GEN3 TaxID=2973478 RepID=UPI00215C5CB8|nr:glycosyltransferase family 2 protein [Facklamia sp. 7083-14-GEN3]MCR8969401.1 glycosyltransferase [Facklamia sp. 7083-14-GEN3]
MRVETEMNPLVSIIVPIYNGESFIPRSLESIINQSYQNIEIICIVNGSTDASSEIIKEYQKKDPRIHLVESEIGDLGRACNIGLDLAKGKYISFVDIDDWVTEDYIDILLSGMNKGYKLCKSNLRYFDNKENPLVYNNKETGFVSIRSATWMLPVRTCAMYDKSLFQNFRYIEFTYYEDLAAWPILVGLAGGVYFINEPLYYYNTTNETSIMSQKNSKHLVMDKVFEFIFNNMTPDIDRETNLLITALFLQSFWTSNIKYINNDKEGRAYLNRIYSVIKDRLIGYHYLVNEMPVSEQTKQKMIQFYQ